MSSFLRLLCLSSQQIIWGNMKQLNKETGCRNVSPRGYGKTRLYSKLIKLQIWHRDIRKACMWVLDATYWDNPQNKQWVFPCLQHCTTQAAVRHQRVNLWRSPGREAEVNKKGPRTGASLRCRSWGVTLEIGTGLSWGRLPEWLARRTERPLSGLCARKCWAKQAPTPLTPPPPSLPHVFFFLSPWRHTQMLIHTLVCIYQQSQGMRLSLQLVGG